MKILKWLVILIICFQAAVEAQEINQFDAEGKRHGVWRKNYEGLDVVRYEGTFTHGKETGEFKFYKNKQGKPILAITKDFKADSNVAYVKYFNENGHVISEGFMRDRDYIGNWKYYQKDGKTLLILENYNDAGLLEGERFVYYDNEQIAESKQFVNGKLDGESKWYSENGSILKTFSYSSGELHGPSKIYDAQGNLITEGSYKQGKKDGLWKYYENGEIVETEDFSYKPKYIKVGNQYKKAP